jgi:gas vesicle protein
MDKQKLLIGIGVGLIIGGIIGLLVTPNSGKDNRKIIVTKAKEFSASVRDFKGRFAKKK